MALRSLENDCSSSRIDILKIRIRISWLANNRKLAKAHVPTGSCANLWLWLCHIPVQLEREIQEREGRTQSNNEHCAVCFFFCVLPLFLPPDLPLLSERGADVFIHSSQHLWAKPPVFLLSYQSAHNFTRIHTQSARNMLASLQIVVPVTLPFSLSLFPYYCFHSRSIRR